MKVEDAIQKGLDAGWNDDEFAFGGEVGPKEQIWQVGAWMYDSRIFLDPSLWQSLGMALGWNKEDELHQRLWEKSGGAGYMPVSNTRWVKKWHRFIDHLADGKTAEEFFANFDGS